MPCGGDGGKAGNLGIEILSQKLFFDRFEHRIPVKETDQADDVFLIIIPEVSGKVTKSSKDFPYIEEHMTVRMAEPKAATAIKDRIREKETRQQELMAEIREVEEFISGLPKGMERNILEMVYLEDMSQRDAAEMVGYTQSMVSKIIKGVVKDS